MLSLAFLLAAALATHGLDISHFECDITESELACIHGNGYEFIIIQAQNSNGNISECVLDQYHKAVSAGFKYVDFYLFPDVDDDPVAQTKNTIEYLKANGLMKGNMLWIDVENTDLFFSSCSSNISFLHEVVDTADKLWTGCGLSHCVGMYTSKSQWDPICCGSTEFKDYQLWWPHYNGTANDDDWSPFGGWSHFNIKQYSGDVSYCGATIDQDYY